MNMTQPMSMRVALITNIPAPYRLPVWDSLAQKLGSLQLFFCSEMEPNRVWESEPLDSFLFAYTFLPGVHLFIRSLDWGIHFNPTLWHELERYKPTHILIGGYESPSYLLALLYARCNHIPVTIWWESHALSSRFQNGLIPSLKRWLLGHFDSFCAISHQSKEYLIETMGISEKKIIRTVNTSDVCRWHNTVMNERRKGDCFDHRIHFLFVGQFIQRKGIIELLTAFKSVPSEKGILRLVGHGPQKTEIHTFVQEHNMENVEIVGPTTTMEETARYYAWADVLVMPSLLEVWGLVVNEALASGVYVMASKYAGATYDLIQQAPYDVGMSFDPSIHESFVNALLTVIEKRNTIDRQAISSWGLQHTAETYAQSLLNAISIAER
jgi:glycosyltransferase involved in cell wall biosynthesis